jgi:threonine synthase
MDISKASNFERFVFDLAGRDAAKVRELWRAVDKGGAFDLKQDGLFERVAGYGMVSGKSVHADRMATIRMCAEKFGTVIDPHTADGLKVGLEHREPGIPLVCLETALPAKFEDAIVEALGRRPERPAGLEQLENLPQRYEVLDVDVDAVKTVIASHAND